MLGLGIALLLFVITEKTNNVLNRLLFQIREKNAAFLVEHVSLIRFLKQVKGAGLFCVLVLLRLLHIEFLCDSVHMSSLLYIIALKKRNMDPAEATLPDLVRPLVCSSSV